MHKVVGLIPTRFNSRRLPGKSLKMIGNLPLIIHTYRRTKLAKKQINKLINDGAKIIDIGGESTRPGSKLSLIHI